MDKCNIYCLEEGGVLIVVFKVKLNSSAILDLTFCVM